MVKFDPKDPTEIIPLWFDFSGELDGQTISSCVVAVTVFSGTDATPGAILSGAAASVGDRVRQNIAAGVIGVEYLIKVTATTNTGLKYTLARVLPVKDAGTW